ncbi:MAG: cation transporter [Terracidiphilus sp.]|jgi:copper chaperone CopZ
MPEFMLHIDGMHCGSCVRRVTLALSSVAGTVVNEVKIGEARLTSSTPATLAIAALAKAGFTAHLES